MSRLEKCPFTAKDVLEAFGEEVHMFMHVHVRGYDRDGEGKSMDASFYDKYGAPVYKEDAWMEGYHSVEIELAKHFNECINTETDFPLIAGMAGGAHLYKPVGHDVEPWNWTGWVPKKNIWCTADTFHVNRYFINIRGNEIQNNLWDYHPFQEQNGEEFDDHYEQITPIDSFEGKGYWLKDEPWARYIHIIALKSHNKENGCCLRYNYIVHPLAYRGSLNDIPDNTVDGAQWSILNINHEKKDPKFNDHNKWGMGVHGLEIFNDFTYYYSWCAKDEIININNGTIMNYFDEDQEKKRYIYWFDSYPLEFGEFLLDTALERGVYFHALAANDAFYNRNILPPGSQRMGVEVQKLHEERQSCLLSDPKGYMIKKGHVAPYQPPEKHSTKLRKLESVAKTRGRSTGALQSIQFLKGRPYNADTAFGHTTLIDTNRELKKLMETGTLSTSLDDAEMIVLKWLIEGRFFSHTGVYDIFNYKGATQRIPFMIENQEHRGSLCYQMTEDMELIFSFPPVKSNKVKLVWRYTLQYIKEDNTFETVDGYFKMDSHHPTRLNLSDNYDKTKLKWIRISAFKDDNPQRRAWFNAVRGLAFGDSKPNEKPPNRANRIATTKERKVTQPSEMIEVYEDASMKPFACSSVDEGKNCKLEFYFPKCTEDKEENMYVYNMQVCANLPEENKNTTHTARDPEGNFYLPERILQNVNGFFRLNSNYPTKLKLSYSWDPETVVDKEVYFYCIDAETGHVCDIPLKPISDMPPGYEI